MEYYEAGNLKISKLSLGTVQLGMEYGIHNKTGKPDSGKSFEILKTAVEGGVNSFDTAAAYGDSEIILGNYFSMREEDKNKSVFTTKFIVAPLENMGTVEIEKQIYKLVEKSLERLKIKKIPVYMMHDSTDLRLTGDVIPETLKRLKRDGLIEKAGISVYTSDEINEMFKHDVFDAIQIPLNIMDQSLIGSGLIKALHKRNIVTFVRSVFLQGLFFFKPEELTGNLRAAEKYLILLNKLSEREGLSIAQLAISYVRDIEGVASLVIGAETPEQVKENIKLIDSPPITEKTRNEIEKLFADVPIEILDTSLWKR